MIAIKGMQMPTSCKDCSFKSANWCYMDICINDKYKGLKRVPETNRPDWCPLIDLSAWEDDLK